MGSWELNTELPRVSGYGSSILNYPGLNIEPHRKSGGLIVGQYQTTKGVDSWELNIELWRESGGPMGV